MPSKELHEQQARHNQRILVSIPEDALDWRVTLMMYVVLHGIRAYISQVRPGYAGNNVKYDDIPRILQKELPQPEFSLATDFGTLVKYSYKTRYQCIPQHELERLHKDAIRRYDASLARLKALGIQI